MKNVAIIVAVDELGGFSKNGQIPWINDPNTKEDLTHFQTITTGGICVMGKNTAEDILKLKKTQKTDLLPGRKSYVLSSDSNYKIEGATTTLRCRSVFDDHPNNRIYLIGGRRVFIEGLSFADTVYMTIIRGEYGCDQKFPIEFLSKHFNPTVTKNTNAMVFVKYMRHS